MYNGISAAKAWFIMKYYGHPNTMVLDGGIKGWKRRGYPIVTMKTPVDYTQTPTKTFTAQEPNHKMLIDYEEVISKIGGKNCKLLLFTTFSNIITSLQKLLIFRIFMTSFFAS